MRKSFINKDRNAIENNNCKECFYDQYSSFVCGKKEEESQCTSIVRLRRVLEKMFAIGKLQV
jgi:hypothetical protein